MRVEIGEFNPFKEAAVIRLFNRNNPADRRAAKKLDLDSPYAYNPSAIGEPNPRRPMTPQEREQFIANGRENHYTRAISNSKDPLRRAIGFEYFSRTDPDDVARLPIVKGLAKEAGMDLTRATKIFDFNFDLPGRSDYVELAMSAVKQGMEEFFRRNPTSAVVFYFEHDDLKADPDDYNIMLAMGATDIGQMIYDPAEPDMNHVLYLDKSHFDGRVGREAKKPRNFAKFSLSRLAELETRAHRV